MQVIAHYPTAPGIKWTISYEGQSTCQHLPKSKQEPIQTWERDAGKPKSASPATALRSVCQQRLGGQKTALFLRSSLDCNSFWTTLGKQNELQNSIIQIGWKLYTKWNIHEQNIQNEVKMQGRPGLPEGEEPVLQLVIKYLISIFGAEDGWLISFIFDKSIM